MNRTLSILVSFSLLLSACAGESSSGEGKPGNRPNPPSQETGTGTPDETEQVVEPAEAMVELALIALEDNGMSGPLVGCGDSVVTVTQTGEASDSAVDRITGALTALFAIGEQHYGESGLYNALYQSELTVDTVEFNMGQIYVSLEGTLLSGGTCDDPRIKEQIKETILDNSGMSADTPVTVLVNGKNLDNLLNGKGE